MNICKIYRVNSSELRHRCNSFEVTGAVQVYVSWDFHSFLLTPSVSAPFSPPYPKVSLMVFVVLYCTVVYTVHKMTSRGTPPTCKGIRFSIKTLSHTWIFPEPSEFHILLKFHDLIDLFFFFLFTFQTPVSLPIIWAGLELISQGWILKWDFQYSPFADAE